MKIWYATLAFGAFALLLVGVIAIVLARYRRQGTQTGDAGQDENDEPASATFIPFARTGGLIVIATLAAALTLSNIDVDAKTGAFALLGTIAGYLAATATGKTRRGDDGGGGGDGGGGAGDDTGGGGQRHQSGKKAGPRRRPPSTHEAII